MYQIGGNMKLIKDFRKKLKTEGRSIKWFVTKYLTADRYTYFSFQINGWKNDINEKFIEAIKKYLEE